MPRASKNAERTIEKLHQSLEYPDTSKIDDDALIQMPERFITENKHTTINSRYKLSGIMIEDVVLFGSYVANYLNVLNSSPDHPAAAFREKLRSKIMVINSNYVNYSIEGYEQYVKVPDDTKYRVRKHQGNGTSFNSCVELITVMNDHIYKLKCFPKSGCTQITHLLYLDMHDGDEIIEDLIEEFKLINTMANFQNPEPDHQIITLSREIDLINYKCSIVKSCERIIVNIFELSQILEEYTTYIPNCIIFCPELTTNDNTLSFKVKFDDACKGKKKEITVKVHQSGKIGITGSKSIQHSEIIYEFLKLFIRSNWSRIITIIPRTDVDQMEVERERARVEMLKEKAIEEALLKAKKIKQIIEDYLAL